MTPDQRTEIRARLDAATPGPWEIFGDGSEYYPGIESPGALTIVVWGDKGEDCGVRGPGPKAPKANAELIAHAPSDLRTLDAEVTRLEGVVEKLKQHNLEIELYASRVHPRHGDADRNDSMLLYLIRGEVGRAYVTIKSAAATPQGGE